MAYHELYAHCCHRRIASRLPRIWSLPSICRRSNLFRTKYIRHETSNFLLLLCVFIIQCHMPVFSIYGLLTKCEVKMAGYWPSSFFACSWTETESRSINTQKKNEANIQPSWPNKLGQ